MHDGELIKQLRTSRKVTQTQLSQGICSKTSLVGMENNSVKKISFLTLKAFLDRLNISLAEYEWLRNTIEAPKKTKHSRRVLNKVQEENFDPYKEVANNRKKFKKSADIYYLVLNIQMFLKTEKQRFSEFQMDFMRYECKKIEEYFAHIQEMGQFELDILAEYPFLFSDAFIESNYTRIKKRMRQFASFHNHEKILYRFLTNLTLTYIESNRLKKARSINDDLQKSLSQQEKDAVIYEWLMSEYYKKMIMTRLGEVISTEEASLFFCTIEYLMGAEKRKLLEENLIKAE
ncbi:MULTISPECIES: helix-turn-helix domain-containing protein [unclassified Enterococcus]|uniref:helix-turn-helix domain-containing protein n=1 Tax=unclassified Enterococcus TaxID=2608891 RepID=UPI003D28F245